MPPPRIDPTSDDIESYIRQGFETGNLNWQELAHLDFQELIDLTRYRKTEGQDLEWDFDE